MNYRWSESYGDASAQSGWGMTVNGQNELVVAGLFEGSLTLPAGSSVSAPTSIGTGQDHFVLWLNTDNGQALKVTSLGTTSNDAEKIAVWDFGPNGLLVSGWLAGGGDVDFSPDSSGSIIAVPSGGTSYVRRMSAKLLRVTSSEHGFELDSTKPTITGFGVPGASIEVFADLNRDGTTETSIGTTTVVSDNSWSLTSDAWLPGGPVNVSATQDTGDSELSTADGVITVRSTRPGPLVEFGTNLLADGYINAAEAASNITLRSPFDGSSVSGGASFWVATDTGGNKTFVLTTVGSTAQANNYKDVGFSAGLFREGGQVIDAIFLSQE